MRPPRRFRPGAPPAGGVAYEHGGGGLPTRRLVGQATPCAAPVYVSHKYGISTHGRSYASPSRCVRRVRVTELETQGAPPRGYRSTSIPTLWRLKTAPPPPPPPGEKLALKAYQKLAKLAKKKIAGIATQHCILSVGVHIARYMKLLHRARNMHLARIARNMHDSVICADCARHAPVMQNYYRFLGANQLGLANC